jgi:prepilin-type N-terminal cleavage/methylation domain-containing protein
MNVARSNRSGYTLVEALVVLVIFSVTTAFAAPRVTIALSRYRLDRATAVLASDLEYAETLASRQRSPVVLAIDATNLRDTVTDRVSGTVLLSREMGAAAEYSVQSLTSSPASVQIFPAGLASGQITITLASGAESRQVIVSRTGQVTF